jgi:hypothetical protein
MIERKRAMEGFLSLVDSRRARRLGALAALILATAPSGRCAADEEPETAPAWFAQEVAYLTRDGGRWLTDNTAYRSETEPYPAYGIEWAAGLSGRTARGRLFAVEEDGSEIDRWELYFFWDPLRQRAVAMQIHPDGNFGTGEVTWKGPTERELEQTFWAPGGPDLWER